MQALAIDLDRRHHGRGLLERAGMPRARALETAPHLQHDVVRGRPYGLVDPDQPDERVLAFHPPSSSSAIGSPFSSLRSSSSTRAPRSMESSRAKRISGISR